MSDDPILDIGIPQDQSAHENQMQRVRHQARQDKRNGIVVAAVVIALAAVALIGFGLFSGDDPAAEDETADDRGEGDGATSATSPDPAEQTKSGDDGTFGITEDAASGTGGGLFQPPTQAHLRSDEIAAVFASDIDTEVVSYGIAYVANEDFIVLDARGISVPDLDIAQDFNTVSNLALLTSNGKTWAIDPGDRDRSFLVSNGYIVVVSERPDTVAVIRPNDP